MTEPEDGSSDFNQPRALFSDCVKLCFADCDSAMKYLPSDYADVAYEDIPAKYKELGAEITGYNLVFGTRSRGLMSAKIAEAIKAQVALLAASPAFRDQSGVSSAEAAELCANVLKRIGGIDGFDETGNIWYKNKTKLEPSASEMPEILWRADRSKDANQERDNFPPTLYGSGRVNPSQNLVDAFPMLSGRPITDPNSGYDPNNPYVGRDPRLNDNILFNGATFRKAVIITGTYPNENDESLDNINYGNTSTRTGYYMKKLLRDDVNPLQSSLVEQQHIYPRIRYTEMFLAYAEAANDAWGPKADPKGVGFTAYDVIKAIRQRAGIKDENGQDPYLESIKNDKDKMRELIRNERRIELCFEGFRFWDLRRWKLDITEEAKGVSITNVGAGKKYETISVEKRNFKENGYYGPVPYDQILNFPSLAQNKGW